MLKKAIIKNYKKHEKLVIRFSKNITCLVGDNFAGKSSVLRAVRWALTNKPGGKGFVRWGTKQATVTLLLDKHKLTRTRGTDNTYKLNGDVYRAFGGGVPEDITGLVNMATDNIQQQHEAPFWFSLSPGELNKQLNKIVALDKIDKTQTNLKKERAINMAAIAICENDIAAAKANLKKYKPLKDIKEWVRVADSILEGQRDKTKDKHELRLLVKRARQLKESMRKPPDITEMDCLVDSLERSMEAKIILSRLTDKAIHHVTLKDIKLAEIGRLKKLIDEKTKGKCPICGAKIKPV